MAPRSTRQRIRDASQRAADDMERCLKNLHTLYEIAAGRSDYIDKHLPGLIVVVEGARKVLDQFYEGL